MAEEQCNLLKNGGGSDKVKTYVNIKNSSATVNTPANSEISVPNTSFSVSQGDYMFYLSFNCSFSSTNNMWVYLTDGTNTCFEYRMSLIEEGTTFFFVGSVLANIPTDTTLEVRIVSYLSTNQTFNPRNILIQGIKL